MWIPEEHLKEYFCSLKNLKVNINTNFNLLSIRKPIYILDLFYFNIKKSVFVIFNYFNLYLQPTLRMSNK